MSHPDRLVLLLLLAGGLFFPGRLDALDASLPFKDDFTQANGSGLSAFWSVGEGSFEVNGNQLESTSTGTSLAVLNGVDETDVSVQVEVDLTAGSGVRTAGLVARHSGAGANYYLAHLTNSSGTVTASIFRRIGGTFTQLASAPVGSASGTLRFKVVGNSLKLFLDGGLILFAHDVGLSSGSVGVRTFAASPVLDTFCADLVPVDAAALPFKDEFSHPDGSELSAFWQESEGALLVNGGRLQPLSASRNIAALNGVTEADVLVQAQVDVTDGSGVRSAGLVTRLAGGGAGDYYLGQLTNNAGTLGVSIYRRIGGAFTLIGSGSAASSSGTLRFQTVGSSLKLFLNGDLVAFASDSMLSSGSVGVQITNTGPSMDSFCAELRTPQNATLPFKDSFTQADGSTLTTFWQEGDGAFAVHGGLLEPLSASTNQAFLNGVDESAVAVQAQVTTKGIGGYSAVGMVARATAGGDYYLGLLQDSGGARSVSIFRRVSGSFTLLATNAVADGSGTLRFEVLGTSLKLFLNGALVAYAYDGALASGSVGIWASSIYPTVDDFCAERIVIKNATLPFKDPFTQGNGSQLSAFWQERAGSFEVAGDQLRSNAATSSMATLHGIEESAVAVQASVDATAGSGLRAAGLVARYSETSGGSYYYGLLTNNAGSFTASISRRSGGVDVLLANASIPNGAGTLRMEAVGSSLKLFLDGSLVAYAHDSNLASGSVGVRAFNTEAVIDDFCAEASPLQTAILPFKDNFAQADGTQLSAFWLEREGNFGVTAGALVSKAAGLSRATLHGVDIDDIFVEAVVDTVVGPAGGLLEAGLVSRYTSTGDSFYLGIIVNDNGTFSARILRRIGGVYTLLDNNAIASTGSGVLRFETIGTSLNLFLDGLLVASASDGALSSGSAGILAYGMDVRFDNFCAVGIVNNSPVAGDDLRYTTNGLPVCFSILANDADPDGDPLTIAGISTPDHGLVALHPDNTITYQPGSGFAGSDTFTYEIQDPYGESDTATVTILESPADSDPDRNGFTVLQELALGALATDPSGQPALVEGVAIDVATNRIHYQRSYLRRSGGMDLGDDYIAAGIAYRCPGSAGLVDWLPALSEYTTNPPSLPPAPFGFEWVTHRLIDPIEERSEGFLRIELSLP